MPYEIRRPITSSGPDRWENALTVSRHRTLSGAKRALQRQGRGAQSQGGYSQDRICIQEGQTWRPITSDEFDDDMSELSWYDK